MEDYSELLLQGTGLRSQAWLAEDESSRLAESRIQQASAI